MLVPHVSSWSSYHGLNPILLTIFFCYIWIVLVSPGIRDMTCMTWCYGHIACCMIHYSFSGISHSHAVVRTCTRCACEWIWVSWDCQDVAGFLNLSHTWRIVTSITWSCCFVNFLYHVYASCRVMLQAPWNQVVITCWFKPRWQWLINIQITSRFQFQFFLTESLSWVLMMLASAEWTRRMIWS